MRIINITSKIKRWTIASCLPFTKMCFYNTICKGWIELFGSHDSRKLKYRISLCLIFKDEAPFLKEWIDYHLTIGIDHFYLYNNNSEDNYQNVLEQYIKDGLVTLIEWPEHNSQFKCYKHCFEMFRNESNWISFLDADEFICPKYDSDINDWIKKFDKYHAINIHWLMFCTGGELKHDYSKNVIEQYFTSWNQLSEHGKTIINTRFEIDNWNTWYPHHHTYMRRRILSIKTVVPAVNQFGYMCTVNKTWGGGKNKLENSTIQINHYFTKAWDVWASKMKKTDVLTPVNPKSDINYFYKYELRANTHNYQICRFFIKLKILQGVIQIKHDSTNECK